MSFTFEHAKHGKLELVGDADTITQEQVERFVQEYGKLGDQFTPYGKIVRAAIAAGWLLEPPLKVESVGQKTSKWFTWAGKIIDDLYGEATKPDPKAFETPPASPAA